MLNPTAAFQCFIDEKTGLKSFDEIKDKKFPLRIGINRKGTLMQVSSQKVLEAYGITFADISEWGGKVHMVPGPQAADLWDAGQLDGIVEFSQYPASRFLEHSKKHKLRILPIAKEKIPGLCKDLSVTPTVISANTYPFQKEDYTSINTKLLLTTSAEQSEEMIYNIVKAVHSNLDYLHKVHANLKALSAETMAKGVLVDLHPGALKFYREIGALQ